MEKTLNTLLAALIVSVGFGSAGCSSVVNSYNPTNTSESTNHSSGVEGIVAAEVEKPETPQKQCYCLKENEHILPDNIVESFTPIVSGDSKAHWHMGYYFSLKLSETAKAEMVEIREQFYQTMQNNGYSPEQIQSYLASLAQPGSIVIKESSFNSDQFKETLEHERVHYEFDKRTMQEKEMLLSLHQELMKRDATWRRFSQVIGLVFYTTNGHNNFGDSEFVAHLVESGWYLVEPLKKEFPQEYDILHEIKEAVEAKECACGSVK